MKLLILLLSSLSLAIAQVAVFQKVILSDPAAVCLDGTPGAYYISRGTDPSRIILYFEGGGWCGESDLPSTIESCYQRSKGNLGSSKNYPDTVTYSQGILSNNINNDFREATKVFLKYCDGAGHQGFRAAPLNYKDAKLYFRGHNVTMAQFADVQRTEGLFSKATDIIVAGRSAGGLAVFLWANYVRENAKAENIYAVPDSGIFLDSPQFQTGSHSYLQSFKNLFKLSNQQAQPPTPQCLKSHKNEPYKCMLAQNLHKFLSIPLFPIQSLYDNWSIPHILGIHCLDNDEISLINCGVRERIYIEEYRRNLTQLLGEVGEGDRNGFWAPSCAYHSFSMESKFYNGDYRVPMGSQYSIDVSLLSWIMQEEGSHHHIDQLPWPLNKPCSGINNFQRIN